MRWKGFHGPLFDHLSSRTAHAGHNPPISKLTAPFAQGGLVRARGRKKTPLSRLRRQLPPRGAKTARRGRGLFRLRTGREFTVTENVLLNDWQNGRCRRAAYRKTLLLKSLQSPWRVDHVTPVKCPCFLPTVERSCRFGRFCSPSKTPPTANSPQRDPKHNPTQWLCLGEEERRSE